MLESNEQNKFIKKQEPVSTQKKVDKLYWAKVKEEAILPTKRDDDAGYDIYYCGKQNEFKLRPGEIVKLPTGIASAFPKEFVGLVQERGSTGAKCMAKRMGTIDASFRGEWFIGINNTSNRIMVLTNNPKDWQRRNEFYNNDAYIIYPLDKAIAQVVFVPLMNCQVNNGFISIDELQKMTSERGSGSLDSTNK